METQPPWVGSDPLGEALHTLRMSGTFYCRSELIAPWGMTLPATPACMWFHLATSGAALLAVAGTDEPLWVRPGELVLVPALADRQIGRVLAMVHRDPSRHGRHHRRRPRRTPRLPLRGRLLPRLHPGDRRLPHRGSTRARAQRRDALLTA